VRLKSFRDIPTADVEVVLPGLKVERMKSADIFKIVVCLLAGVATAVYSFLFGRSYSFATATLTGLLAFRAYQTWAWVNNAKYTMNEFIRTTLYHRSQDSQGGVLLTVLNSIAQHELREALTFYLLLCARNPASAPLYSNAGSETGSGARVGDRGGSGRVTLAEAEQLATDFLERDLGILVDVRAEETLLRLERIGLVRKEPLGANEGLAPAIRLGLQCYTAVTIPEALSLLRSVWGDLQRDVSARQTSASLQLLTMSGSRRRASTVDDLEEPGSPLTPGPTRRDLSL
jgi:hypothetical protein